MQFASFQQLLQEAFGLVDIILEQTFLYFIMLLANRILYYRDNNLSVLWIVVEYVHNIIK